MFNPRVPAIFEEGGGLYDPATKTLFEKDQLWIQNSKIRRDFDNLAYNWQISKNIHK